MRIAACVERAESDNLQQLIDAVLDVVLRCAELVDFKNFGQHSANGDARIERAVGVLENNLHVAAHLAQTLAGHLRDFLTLELDRSRGRFDEAKNRAACGRLAAARLADQAQRLAAPNGKRHVIDRFDVADRLREDTLLDREIFLQSFDFEDVFSHAVTSGKMKSEE